MASQRTVIAQYIGYKWDNRYLPRFDQEVRPDTSRACAASIRTDPAAPDQLSRLTEQGFHGVRISPSADASGDWINGPLMPPLWKRARIAQNSHAGLRADHAHAGPGSSRRAMSRPYDRHRSHGRLPD